MRRSLLLFLAVLLAAFVAFYPYLDGMGLCVSGGCPDAQQASSSTTPGGFSGVCLLVAVLGSSAGMIVLTLGRMWPATTGRRLTQLYLPPDPPPPRFL